MVPYMIWKCISYREAALLKKGKYLTALNVLNCFVYFNILPV